MNTLVEPVVTEVRPALTMSEGDGAEVQRLFPLRADRMNFDPFVLWDHFHIEPGNGFPTHPHRGFEAITYMFRGGMEHKDNLGNHSVVYSGGAQRFTAGRGIEHSETPAGEGQSSGIQLWINLPRKLKIIDPDYQQVDAAMFPIHELDKARTRVIVGEGSPLLLHTPVQYLDVQLEAGGEYSGQITAGHRGLVYVVEGEARVGELPVRGGEACFIDGLEQLSIKAHHATRFMWCMGQPHGEPIHQHGPFVD